MEKASLYWYKDRLYYKEDNKLVSMGFLLEEDIQHHSSFEHVIPETVKNQMVDVITSRPDYLEKQDQRKRMIDFVDRIIEEES
jgi:hypothetical protein